MVHHRARPVRGAYRPRATSLTRNIYVQTQEAKFPAKKVPPSLLAELAVPDALFEAQSLVGLLPSEAPVLCTVDALKPHGVVYNECKLAWCCNEERNVVVWSI